MLTLVPTVLIPIPDNDFDSTEVAVNCQVLTGAFPAAVAAKLSGS
jgi:hypothetical protein